MVGGMELLATRSHAMGINQVQKTGTDVLLDLLTIGTPPAQSSLSTLYGISSTQDNNTSKGALERLSSPSVQSVQASSPVMDLLDGFGPSEQMCEDSGPACPSIVAFESSHLRMMFNFSKQPGNLQATFIEANFLNKSSDVYTDFIFQAAVPKFLQLHLDLASSNSLPASEEGSITQKLRVTNSQHGKDCTSITSSGVCKIFGSRCCIPLFELDFSAAPFVFLYLHSNLLLSSATLPYALVLYWNGMAAGGDSIPDDEELQSCIPCDGDKSGSRTGVSGNGNSEKRRRALDPSSAALKLVSRTLQLKNTTVSPRIIMKRRRSLRSRRGRNISPFVVRKANGTLLTNLPSRYAGIPFSPVTSNHELISPVQGDFTTNIKELKSTLIGLTEDIDTSSCSANILVIESDKCYREEGATVTVENSASNQWFVMIKRDGITRYNLMAQQVMRPCSCNRVTHAIIWTIDHGWKLEFPNRRDWSIFKKLYKECSDHNVHSPTVSVIPVPGVLEVSSYDDSNTVSFERPQSYITWKDDELTRVLTKGTANYDLDSDDEAWLNKFNNEIFPENELVKHVSADAFELIINSFEKGFYCGEDDYSDVRPAVDLCKNLERREVLEAVHSYWMKKQKHKRSALTRVFQCYQPRRTPILPKVIIRKKRSFQRQPSKAGRDKQQTFLQADLDAEDEQKIIVKIQEAKAAAIRSEGMAVLRRKRTQMLMETADLATYKATMALRIAQAARLAEPLEVAASFFLC